MTRRPASLMIQGAGSNVGKSMLVAGLARAMTTRGLRVRPFKPQNMSNNAAATPEGGEIGRAQALQARACGVAPHVDMNPVLLKPESETGAQVVVRGKVLTTAKARDYKALKPKLLPAVLESFEALGREADIVLVEGAGSPAEINLRDGDIANMGFARAAEVPVVLAGDIDRGGVIAQLVGTHAVLDLDDRAMIRGFLVNKFRGDVSLFEDGMVEIARRTGWRSLGVAPWFADAHKLPAEDAADLRADGDSGPVRGGPIRIAVPVLSRIANFDDLDPLRLDPAVSLTMAPAGRAIPDCDLVLLPGSKATLADLAHLRAQGWDVDIKAHVRRGGRVLGLCGGYQMMGRRIADPEGLEGAPGEVEGLGLLDVETVMTPEKSVRTAAGVHLASGAKVSGYEIHIGRTTGPDCDRPLFELEGGRSEGAASPDGRCMGAYLHGLFSEDGFRSAWLRALGAPPSTLAYDSAVEATLDALAAHLEAHLDIDAMLDIASVIPS